MALRRNADAKGAPVLWTGAPFRVLALDPGGTTGWKYADWLPHHHHSPTLPTHVNDFNWQGGQIGPDEHHEELWNLLNHFAYAKSTHPLHIVCEAFEFRQHINKENAKTKVELISKEYIGLVKLFAARIPSVTVDFPTASMAKSLIPDKGEQANVKLKQLGLYETANRHQNDAARHLIRHLVVTLRIREPITNVWLGKEPSVSPSP